MNARAADGTEPRWPACALLAASLLLAAACGGGGGRRANVTIEPMPEGGTFTGVWFSPQYGEMHLVQSGSHVVGEYSKDERRGRIEGTVQGNVLRFRWEEERELVHGRPIRSSGRGYFRYVIGQDGRHYILGEWGLGEDEVGGGPWRAYKLRRRRPAIAPPERSGGERATSGGALEERPSRPAHRPPPESSEPAPVTDELEGLDEF